MNYIVLIAVIAILALSAWRGYRAGIVRMVLYIVTLVLTIVLAGLLLRPVSLLVKENTSLYQNIETSVEEVINEHEIADIESIKQLPFPEYMLDGISTDVMIAGDFRHVAAVGLAGQIFNAIIYICLNFVIYIIIRIIVGTFDIVTRLPVIKEVNKLAGFAVGLIEGIILVWLLCLVLQACGSEVWAQKIFVQINDNSFLSWIYNNNLVEMFLRKFI